MSDTQRDCQHGQLARVCLTCELEAEVASLRAFVGNNLLRSDYQTVDHMRAEIAALRAALKRCHDLLQEAEAFTDCDVRWQWGAAVVAELLACDETGECPTIAAAREGKK